MKSLWQEVVIASQCKGDPKRPCVTGPTQQQQEQGSSEPGCERSDVSERVYRLEGVHGSINALDLETST